MTPITFANVPKSLLAYIASQTSNISILTALAIASASQPDMEGLCSVTIKEDEVVEIFRTLSNDVSEGVAAQPNAALEALLTPLLPARPELMAQVVAIKTGNLARLTDLQNSGLVKLETIQAAITANS